MTVQCQAAITGCTGTLIVISVAMDRFVANRK